MFFLYFSSLLIVSFIIEVGLNFVKINTNCFKLFFSSNLCVATTGFSVPIVKSYISNSNTGWPLKNRHFSFLNVFSCTNRKEIKFIRYGVNNIWNKIPNILPKIENIFHTFHYFWNNKALENWSENWWEFPKIWKSVFSRKSL